MGTNFYAQTPRHGLIHIGKQSGGWKFGFHSIPERGLTSWRAWRKFLKHKKIVDEYGTRYTLKQFEEKIVPGCPMGGTTKPLMCRVPAGNPDRRLYHDEDDYDFYEGTFS